MSKLTTLIVGANYENIIGQAGGIPWRHKADMVRFKELTMGGVLIMGRKTYESLPKPTLPGRVIVVLSRAPYALKTIADIQLGESPLHAATTFEGAMTLARETGRRIWIAGGADIYKLALDAGVVEVIDRTRVQASVDPDKGDVVKMPEIDHGQFINTSSQVNPSDPSLLHETWMRRLAA